MLSVPLAGLAQNILTLLNILFSHSLFITYQQVMLYYGVIAMLICTVQGKISLLCHRGVIIHLPLAHFPPTVLTHLPPVDEPFTPYV